LRTSDESAELGPCEKWSNCEIASIPYVVDKDLGSGWIFPKKSAFLPIFKYYISRMKEGAIYRRIISSQGMPRRICPEYAGKPIGLEKVVSLLGVIILGAGFSVILLL
jgi:hypothetical protein